MQPELYQSFAKETSHLEQHFGHLGESGSYILGDDAHGLQWHVYVVGEDPTPTSAKAKPVYTLEVCMTELCPAKVRAHHPHQTIAITRCLCMNFSHTQICQTVTLGFTALTFATSRLTFMF